MFRHLKILAAVAFCLFGLTALAASAADVTWSAPETRVDGSAFSPDEVEFYELCATQSSDGACAGTPFVFETTSTTVPIESLDLSYGTWYFTVRVQDTGGLVSEWAVPVSHQILAPPNPPVGLGVN